MVRVLAMPGASEEYGTGGSRRVLVDDGCESSVFTTGLSLELRGSCAVNTAVAARIPSFAGPSLPLVVRTSCDERRWSRRDGVEAVSGCDGPVIEAGGSRFRPEPLITVVVEKSSRLAIPIGPSAIFGKQRCASCEDVEESIPVGLGVLVSSRPHLKAIPWGKGSGLE